ncbi:HupE/UreJ family protein [Aquabacterium sp. OR-4]|uniref:HupE/UreJ family protein n=1 Tax=Aquabacterium sp. OR-4 TaxID=2978127 RepID=UPI0028C87F2D|nr:HupE/UreJ family protein [Aquabacterium sp. OR-4]MDT7835274.1 HupE/UreJ family protein [Aquabacterium sp. OR-4]
MFWRWLGLLGLLCPLAAPAHQASDAYLQVQAGAERSSLRADVALRDLDLLLPTLDADGDRQLTWAEVRRAQPLIAATVLGALQLGDCRFQPLAGEQALERRADGVYAVVRADAACRVAAGTPARWHLLAGIDDTHRALLRLNLAEAGAPHLRVLVPSPAPRPGEALSTGPGQAADAAGPSDPATRASQAAVGATGSSLVSGVASASASLVNPVVPATVVAGPASAAVPTQPPAAEHASFIVEGAVHLLNGWDHLLFLVCLLLPAVLQRGGADRSGGAGGADRSAAASAAASSASHGWRPVADLRGAVGPVLRTITLFTLAHSITLALSALGRWQPLPWLIEPAIALTILVAAVDNLRPRLWRWRDALTFGFGLVHGFGFAGVLAELDLPGATFGWALLQFNLGLEAGQLAVVALLLPLLMTWRVRAMYVPAVLRGGSGVAAAVAAFWFVERCLGAAALV